MSKKKFLNAFTVLELVAVVAILSLLLVIAYPSYKEQLRYNHVALVKAHLLDISNRQGDYLRRHQAYAQDLTELGVTLDKTVDSHYKVMLVDVKNTPDPIGYRVEAVPKTAPEDGADGTLSLNHLGQTSDNWNR